MTDSSVSGSETSSNFSDLDINVADKSEEAPHGDISRSMSGAESLDVGCILDDWLEQHSRQGNMSDLSVEIFGDYGLQPDSHSTGSVPLESTGCVNENSVRVINTCTEQHETNLRLMSTGCGEDSADISYRNNRRGFTDTFNNQEQHVTSYSEVDTCDSELNSSSSTKSPENEEAKTSLVRCTSVTATESDIQVDSGKAVSAEDAHSLISNGNCSAVEEKNFKMPPLLSTGIMLDCKSHWSCITDQQVCPCTDNKVADHSLMPDIPSHVDRNDCKRAALNESVDSTGSMTDYGPQWDCFTMATISDSGSVASLDWHYDSFVNQCKSEIDSDADNISINSDTTDGPIVFEANDSDSGSETEYCEESAAEETDLESALEVKFPSQEDLTNMEREIVINPQNEVSTSTPCVRRIKTKLQRTPRSVKKFQSDFILRRNSSTSSSELPQLPCSPVSSLSSLDQSTARSSFLGQDQRNTRRNKYVPNRTSSLVKSSSGSNKSVSDNTIGEFT